MDRNTQLRREMADILRRIVAGNARMREFSEFAAPLGLDDDIAEDLRVDLDVLLAVADQVEYAHLDEDVFIQDARRTLARIEAGRGARGHVGEPALPESALAAAD